MEDINSTSTTTTTMTTTNTGHTDTSTKEEDTTTTTTTGDMNSLIVKSRALFVHGKFLNPYLPKPTQKIMDIIKWLPNRPSLSLTKHEQDVLHPILEVDFNRLAQPVKPNSLRTTWIGHSTFFVQTAAGVTFLTDPVWSQRCSPVQWAGPKRYRDTPCKIKDLPKVDFVVISHNHYDHLDHASVMELGNSVKWFVPKGLAKWFAGCGITNVSELEWWEDIQFNDRVKLTCTPCSHYGQRNAIDRGTTLWCSWAIKDTVENKTFWFAGDTAYCGAFKEIGHHVGPIDFAFIPIGAYHPRHIMHEFHVDPLQAVQIHQDIKSKSSVGMHWGTFILTDEPLLEPPKLLQSEAEKAGVPDQQFFVMKIGEVKDIDL